MSLPIDLSSDDKLYLLTQPRYAVITWPSVLASFGFFTGHWSVVMGLMAVTVWGVLRLTKLKLLPHESVCLTRANAAMNSAQPALAVDILQADLPFIGTHYLLKRAILLSDAYSRQGKFIEAHAALAGLKYQHLQKDEALQLQVAWARLFLEVGNPAAAQRRLGDITEQKCMANLGCLLVRAELELLADNFAETRRLLESGLDRYQERSERIVLLNNLARLELLQERTDAQLRHLQAARREFNKQPNADLTNVIHHNLAIALVRNGQFEEAKQVLDEAQAVIERNDIQQVLDLFNNQLLAAREASDAKWIKDVYVEFERELERLRPNTEQERLMLEISKLRMHRNDRVDSNFEDYPARIECLLKRVKNSSDVVPMMERLHGLSELRADLKHELQSQLQQGSETSKQLEEFMELATCQLLEYSDTIDTELSSVSPLLIRPLEMWYRFRTDADKARIQLAENPEQLQAAFSRLFNHLREKAEWLTEQGIIAQAIEAWLILCDELVAYHDELPLEAQQNWRQEYNSLAQDALQQASTQMLKLKRKRLHIDQMIGLAYFHLRLRGDKRAAAYWINIIHRYQPSLHHFALWLREYYVYVCEKLGLMVELRV